MFISAIIPAAGSGVRFGDKKQFKVINGHPLIYHTLKPFLESNMINEVVVVASEQDIPPSNVPETANKSALVLISPLAEI